MITLLMKLGLSSRVASLIAYVAVPLLILGAFYLALDAYGDSRYREGEAHADEAWKDASDKLVEDAARAGAKADKNAAGRAADFAAKQEDEKERIDAAIEHGTSPLDAIFGAAD